MIEATAVRRWPRQAREVSVVLLAFGAGAFFALVGNGAFLRAVMAGRPWQDPQTWLFGGAMLTLLIALHGFLLLLVLVRPLGIR